MNNHGNIYIPVGTKVICSTKSSFIGKTVSEAKIVTFCEFGHVDSYYEYEVKKHNGEIVKCGSRAVNILPKENPKKQRFSNYSRGQPG